MIGKQSLVSYKFNMVIIADLFLSVTLGETELRYKIRKLQIEALFR